MNYKKFIRWFDYQKKINELKIKQINLKKIDKWKINIDKIYHNSKKFFKIVGIEVKSNFFKKNWDQPIIIQNEIGILGIIKNNKTQKYLLQAKVEPGNINKLQLAPSVQATESNFKGIHGGKKVPYINFFLKLRNKKIYHQSEQGFRYLNKFNSNILFITNRIIKKKPNFFWFSKNEIKKLINMKNIINMDTLSIFSTVINRKRSELYSVNTKKQISNWFKRNDKKYFIQVKKVSLHLLKDWFYKKGSIFHKNKKHFSVIGIDIKTTKRENNKWSQPIIKGKKIAFAGFIIKKFNNQDHYLCRYILKPGLRKSVVSCTVNTSDLINYKTNNNLSNLQKSYMKRYFLDNKTNIIYDNILSEEGGRFFRCQIRYMIVEIESNVLNKIPNNLIWLSHNQIVDLIKKKRLDIESRLLFACGNIDLIK